MSLFFRQTPSLFDGKATITDPDIALKVISSIKEWRSVAILSPEILKREWLVRACKADESIFDSHCPIPLREAVASDLIADCTNPPKIPEDILSIASIAKSYVAKWPANITNIPEKIRYVPAIFSIIAKVASEEYLVIAVSKFPENFLLCQPNASLEVCKATIFSFPYLYRAMSNTQRISVKDDLLKKCPETKDKLCLIETPAS